MSKLSPEAAAVLASARKDLGASAEVAARVKAAVIARSALEPPPSGTRLRSAWSAVRRPGQMLAVIALVGGAFVTTQMTTSTELVTSMVQPGAPSSPDVTPPSEAPRAASVVSAPKPSVDEASSNDVVSAAPSFLVTALPDGPRPIERPRRAQREPHMQRDTPTQKPVVPVPVAVAAIAEPSREGTSTTDDLVEESRLMRAAQLDLRAHRTDAAQRSLDEHAARFPFGVLREERLTLRVLVLCEAGQIEAGRSARAELERTFPSTSHASRLAASCAAPEGE